AIVWRLRRAVFAKRRRSSRRAAQPAAPLSWPPAVVPKRCRPPGPVRAEWPATPTPANARAIGKKTDAAARFLRWGLSRSTWAAFRSCLLSIPKTFSPSGGQCEIKGRADAGFGFNPDLAAVPFDNLLTNGQANASARIFFATMKPLENHEDPLEML